MGLAMTPEPAAALEIRPAATVVLWRPSLAGPQVLMGQRGAHAAFMPSKYVFPGGAVDADDENTSCALTLHAACWQRLDLNRPPESASPRAIVAAAVRELWEETGLQLTGNHQTGHPLRFIFRAITPPGRSRRFDARFFLADAASVTGNPEDFSAASDELSHLHWIGLTQARALDLPFITEVVLAEIGQLLRCDPTSAGVPFFDNSGHVPTFRRLN